MAKVVDLKAEGGLGDILVLREGWFGAGWWWWLLLRWEW